jgi:hypothetical protein
VRNYFALECLLFSIEFYQVESSELGCLDFGVESAGQSLSSLALFIIMPDMAFLKVAIVVIQNQFVEEVFAKLILEPLYSRY